MDKKLTSHLQHLTIFNNQRRGWLLLSFFVMAVIAKIIFSWDQITTDHFMWFVVSAGLTVSATWWYWTMRLIRDLIKHRKEEAEILHELIVHIRAVQNEVRDLATKSVDNPK